MKKLFKLISEFFLFLAVKFAPKQVAPSPQPPPQLAPITSLPTPPTVGDVLQDEDGQLLFVLGTDEDGVWCQKTWQWYNPNVSAWEQSWADQVIVLSDVRLAASLKLDSRYEKIPTEVN